MKDISLHLMDIAQNSIVAGANLIVFRLFTEGKPAKLIFEIEDNGKGMDKDFLKEVTDPFKTSRTTRKVGLGIPLLKQSSQMAGGELSLQSELLKGTSLRATFDVNHIDRIPLGDVSETMKMLIMANPQVSWIVKFSSEMSDFELDTEEIKRQLDGIPIQNIDVLNWIQNTISNGVRVVFGGVLDEIN